MISSTNKENEMSFTMYEVTNTHSVNQVECDRITKKSVFTKNGRRAISSEHSIFFGSKEEAINFIIDGCKKRIARAELAIRCENEQIARIKSL